MTSMQQSQDETKHFISKQNVSMIAQMNQMSFKEARTAVIEWLRKNNGYIQSVSQANEQLISELQGLGMNRRPLQTSQMGKTMSLDDRMRKMQQERDGMTPRPPMNQLRPSTDENVLVNQMNLEDREEMAKQTARRLEQMQKERSNPIQIQMPQNTQSISEVKPGGSDITLLFHSTYAEKKKAQEWWNCEWSIPELYRMAMASHFEIPYIHIVAKRRSMLRRLFVKVANHGGGGETIILTPSQSKHEGVRIYEVREEIHNELDNTWSYHLYPNDRGDWLWNKKVDYVDISLLSLGKEFGRFWDDEEIESWSIITKWYRPK